MTTTLNRYVIQVEVVGDASLRKFQTQAEQVGARIKTLNNSIASSGSGFSKLGFQVQNASYQIGDFAVQVASGTAASRAFAQQAPQLLGGFGLWGAALGAVVAVGAALTPVLGDLLAQSSAVNVELGALQPVVDGLSNAVKSLGSVVGPVFSTLANNLDRIVYYGTALATVIGVRLATAFVTSGRAATFFAATLGVVQKSVLSLVRVAPQLAAAFALGEVIYRFQVLVEKTGSLGAALDALLDVGKTFAEGFKLAFGTLPDALQIVWNRIKATFLDLIVYLDQKLAEFFQSIAAGISSFGGALDVIPGLGKVAEMGQDIGVFAAGLETAALDLSIRSDELRNAAAGIADAAADDIAAGNEKMISALKKLNELTTDTTKGVKKMSDDFDELGDASGGAADKVKENTDKIVEEVTKLTDVGNIVSNSFGNAFSSLIDGSKKAGEAFSDLLSGMIEDIATFLFSQQFEAFLASLSQLQGLGFLGTTSSVPVATTPTVQVAAINPPQVRTIRSLTSGGDVGLGSSLAYVNPAPITQTNPGASVGGLVVNINNTVSGADVSATEGTNGLGQRTLDIMVADKVKSAIRSGALDQTLGTTYGLRRRAR